MTARKPTMPHPIQQVPDIAKCLRASNCLGIRHIVGCSFWRRSWAAAFIATASLQAMATPAAEAAEALRTRATASLAKGDLAWARLQWQAAQRLEPAVINPKPLSTQLDATRALQASLVAAGQHAADRRDLAGVQAATLKLRQFDIYSPDALALVLRYQAALADRGGAFRRVHWADLVIASRRPKRMPQTAPAAASNSEAGIPHALPAQADGRSHHERINPPKELP